MTTLHSGKVRLCGRGDSNFKNVGDAHDWGIWHDGYAFDSLWSRVPKFMSEYGFQSFPANSTFNSILSHDSIMLLNDFRTHPEIMAHEKHPRGFDIIDSYMERTHGALMCDSMSFEDWAYLSRVIQAEGIAEGAIAGRLRQTIVQALLSGSSTIVGLLPHGHQLTVTVDGNFSTTN